MTDLVFRDFNSYQLIESIIDISSSAIAIKDLDHRYVLVNQAFASLLGIPKEIIVGNNDRELGTPESLLNGDEIRRITGSWKLDDRAVDEQHLSVADDALFNSTNSQIVYVNCARSALVNRHGQTQFLLIHASELEQQKISQKDLESQVTLLQAVLDANPDAVVATDSNRKIVFENQAMSALLDSAKPTQRVLSSDIQPLMEKAGNSREQTRILRYSSESIRNYKIHEQSIAVQPGQPSHIVGIFSDITDREATDDSTVEEQKKLARRNEFLSAVNTFTLKLGNNMELNPLLQQIVDELIHLFGANASFISTVHESGEFLEMAVSAGNMLNDKSIRHKKGEGMAGSAWATQDIQVIDNYGDFTAKMPGYEKICQGLAIPIMADTEVAGVIGITFENYNSDLVDQIDLVRQFAQLVNVAIDNAKLLETKNKEIARIDALNQLSRTMFGSTDLDEVLKKVAETIIDVVDAKQVGIFEVDANDLLRVRVDAKCDSKPGRHDKPLPFDEKIAEGSLIRWSLDHQQMAAISRMAEDPREVPAVHRFREQQHIGATVTIPLAHAETVWGVLAVQRDRANSDFSQEDINLITVVANQASIILHRQGLLETIHHQAYHDSLTGLSNRLSFEVTLDKAVQSSSSSKQKLAILFIDLDGFKSVNDTLGHALGDRLLVQVSNRLKHNLKADDTLARMGGDEFAILIRDIDSDGDAIKIAKRLLGCLQSEFDIDGVRLTIGASIGISFFPADGNSANELLKSADIAMYQAKDGGKNNYHCFSQVLARNYQLRIQTEIDLKTAIEKKQFELYYQPQVSSKTGLVSGVEALVRWHHPERGLVSPGEFIPIAEESGLIKDIGEWVLNEACFQGARWHQNGFPELTVAVNISSPQFSTANFVESVHQSIRRSEFDPRFLELEVTESFVMKDIDTAVEKLRELGKLGIEISVDDFGTGYSSLRYLEKLPVNKLKIDRSFVIALGDNKTTTSIASTIILMAQSLKLQTIAEGIETKQQLDRMRDMGADQIQGYYYSKPVPAEKLPRVIRHINAQAPGSPEQLKRAI